MRYLVTVEVQEVRKMQFSVEAASENEASLTAVALASRYNPTVIHTDTISVEEDAHPDHNDMTTHGDGYLKGII